MYGEVVPADAFVDRVDELRRLVADLAAGQKVFLISPRRYGKSSLIRRALSAMAMTENWDGGSPVCNRYAYRFRRVVVAGAAGGAWHAPADAQVRQDRGYRVVRRDAANFLAASTAAPAAVRTTASAVPDERRRARRPSR